MPISAAGSNGGRAWRDQSGFTLVELLVALTIVAVVTGVAALALPRLASSAPQREADRLAALFDAARDRAQRDGQPLAWIASADGYLFVGRSAAGWTVLQTPPLQPRRWAWLNAGAVPQRAEVDAAAALDAGAVGVTLSGGWREPDAGANWLGFGVEPVQPAAAVDIDVGADRLRIASDGLQPFQVSSSR